MKLRKSQLSTSEIELVPQITSIVSDVANSQKVLELFVGYNNCVSYWTHGGQIPMAHACCVGGLSFSDDSFLLYERFMYMKLMILGAQ